MIPLKTPSGALGLFVLATIHTLGKESYGISITEHLQNNGKESLDSTRVYQVIATLLESGLVLKADAEKEKARRGRPPTRYVLAPKGIETMEYFQFN